MTSHSPGGNVPTRSRTPGSPRLRATMEIHNPSGGCRGSRTWSIEGPRNVTGVSDTPSRQRVSCAIPRRRRKSRRARRRSYPNSHGVRSGVRSRKRTSQRRSRSTTSPRQGRRLRRRYSRGSRPHAGESVVPVSRRERTRRRAGRLQLPYQRHRASLAVVVLPLVEHPRRRAARAWRSKASSRNRACCGRRSNECSRTRARKLSSRISSANGCSCATSRAASSRISCCSRISTATCETRTGPRPRCCSRTCCTRAPAAGAAHRELHVCQRAARAPVRYPRRIRRAVPSRRDQGSAALGSVRPRQHPVVDSAATGPRRSFAASSSSRSSGTIRRRRRRRTCRRSSRARRRDGRRRCASSSNCIEPIRIAPACHKNIDPVGFALENFDADGSWRDKTRDGLPIDSAGVLADGTEVDGPVQLREALLANPEIFAGTLTKKMLIYAFGRGLEPADMPVVRVHRQKRSQAGLQLEGNSIGYSDSYPFQMRMNGAAAERATVAQARE